MNPQKVELKRLPELPDGKVYGYTSEQEAARFAEKINQPFYYHFPPNHTYYVPICPGQVAKDAQQ